MTADARDEKRARAFVRKYIGIDEDTMEADPRDMEPVLALIAAVRAKAIEDAIKAVDDEPTGNWLNAIDAIRALKEQP
jgi:hypothetical protein